MELIVYVLLMLTSVVGLTFIIERGLALRWPKVLPPSIEAAVRACGSRGEIAMLQAVCHRYPSPLGRILTTASEHLDWPKAENVDAIQTQARHEIVKLERGLVVLEVIVGIAPLLGLVGTIVGMMTLFTGLGETGLTNTEALAKGIGTILNATLLGLLIAIPCLVFWSYYNRKVETMAVEMETLCDQFVRRQYRGSSMGN
ncbi:MAG: MotA/TolQ/ExbB proton channel family protein [Verrucomicrobia bacterium]|jgi:biopolymer transport protein ExbB|nr:MotA/TolQ/ExbB proton channel family protein [Verrucomicrobiota bacterium]